MVTMFKGKICFQPLVLRGELGQLGIQRHIGRTRTIGQFGDASRLEYRTACQRNV